MFKMFWKFFTIYHSIFSKKVKQNLVINTRNWVYELSHELLFDLRLTSLESENLYLKDLILKTVFLFRWSYFMINRSSLQSCRKRCSENMQQIYRGAPMAKYDFNKVDLQLYWNHTSTWALSCKISASFQSTFWKYN